MILYLFFPNFTNQSLLFSDAISTFLVKCITSMTLTSNQHLHLLVPHFHISTSPVLSKRYPSSLLPLYKSFCCILIVNDSSNNKFATLINSSRHRALRQQNRYYEWKRRARIMIAYDIDRRACNFTQITLRWSQFRTNFTFQAGLYACGERLAIIHYARERSIYVIHISRAGFGERIIGGIKARPRSRD